MTAKSSFRNIAIASFIAILILGLARIIAPSQIVKFINSKLDQTPGISGQVEDVDLAIYRGAYKVKGIKLYLQENIDSTPTIEIQTVDLSILWSALFRGEIVAEVHVYNGNFEFVDVEEQENNLNEEVKNKQTWLTLINAASPISIDKVVIHNNTIALTTQTGDIVHKNFIDKLNGEITNITNSREFSGNKVARFVLEGQFMSAAKAVLSGSLDPDTPKPTFDLNFEMQKLPIEHVSALIDFYAPLDVEDGTIDAALEIVAKNGEVNGYVKAGIYDTQVFTWQGDIVKDDDGLLTGIFEGLVDVFASIFESDKKNQIAVNVPITGTIDNTEVSTFDAISSLFYNAFVNAYEITIDDSYAADEPIPEERGSESSNDEDVNNNKQ